ncbi:MAG: hypothetical protein J2O44_02665 [Porphyrobacter sp.]|nr:hypothetical protein [Porphyrobacter sp.]
MVQLVTNQPLRSKVPQITVENPLKPGSYRFSLVVLDDAQNESQPAELTVTVVQPTRTVVQPAVLRAATTVRQPISATPLRPKTPQ